MYQTPEEQALNSFLEVMLTGIIVSVLGILVVAIGLLVVKAFKYSDVVEILMTVLRTARNTMFGIAATAMVVGFGAVFVYDGAESLQQPQEQEMRGL